MPGSMIGQPFAMPMVKPFIPKALQPWLYLACAVVFQLVNTIFLGSLQQMVGSTQLMQEDIMFIFICGEVGVAMPFPLLFRLKFRFTNRQLELFAVSGMTTCLLLTLALFNLTDVHQTMPLLCLLSYACGYFKLMATFEIFSNIQLWMTPKRDFRIFFPLLYMVVLGDISASSWISQQLTYYTGSWQSMQWLMVGLLLAVLLFLYVATRPFRFMKPLPFISIDWLGLVLWSLSLLMAIWIFLYGEHYNWVDNGVWRSVLIAEVAVVALTLWRMFHIRHPYISPRAFGYKTLVPILLMFAAAEVMNSTPQVLQNAYTGAVMPWGMLSLSGLNLVSLVGCATGSLFCLWWMKMTRQPYTRLLTVGFGLLLCYQVAMYFLVFPGLPLEALVVPTFLRSFGYSIFFTTLTVYLEELMPFHHFFMGLTICGFIRNGLVANITEGVYGYLLRLHVMDNLVSAHPYTPETSLLTAIKLLFGVTCLGGCAFMLLLMLWHVGPVRSTLKRLPYWGKVGQAMRKELGR